MKSLESYFYEEKLIYTHIKSTRYNRPGCEQVDFKTSCFNACVIQVPICTALALPASLCLFYNTGCRLRATLRCQMQEDVSCSPVPAAAKNKF